MNLRRLGRRGRQWYTTWKMPFGLHRVFKPTCIYYIRRKSKIVIHIKIYSVRMVFGGFSDSQHWFCAIWKNEWHQHLSILSHIINTLFTDLLATSAFRQTRVLHFPPPVCPLPLWVQHLSKSHAERHWTIKKIILSVFVWFWCGRQWKQASSQSTKQKRKPLFWSQ